MSNRDELAERIAGRILVDLGAVVVDGDAADAAHNIAALVEELGYRKPRTITTAEELDALGCGATVLDASQHVWTNDGDRLDQWGCVHHDDYPVSLVWRGSASVALPATVVHDPSA